MHVLKTDLGIKIMSIYPATSEHLKWGQHIKNGCNS